MGYEPTTSGPKTLGLGVEIQLVSDLSAEHEWSDGGRQFSIRNSGNLGFYVFAVTCWEFAKHIGNQIAGLRVADCELHQIAEGKDF